MCTRICFKIHIVMLVLGLLMNPGVLFGKDMNPRIIVEKSKEAARVVASESVATLTIVNAKGQQRVRTIAAVNKQFDKGQTEKRLIRFVAPADVKGTGLLTFDYEDKSDDMWLFMPALRKTRRIVSSDKAKSFMGSEFSYSDITPPALNDFTYQMLPDETVNGVACWVVSYTPKNEDIAEENGYSKRVAHIGKQDYVVRKAVYYDLGGELQKVMTVHAIKEIDPKNHKYRLMHIQMDNKQNNRSSTMHVDKIALRPDVPDEYFTTRYLERQ